MEMYTERQAYDPSRDITMLVSETIQKNLCIMTYKTIAIIPQYELCADALQDAAEFQGLCGSNLKRSSNECQIPFDIIRCLLELCIAPRHKRITMDKVN